MGQMIEQLGFWKYMATYPLNPISMVGVVVLIGILVLFINRLVAKLPFCGLKMWGLAHFAGRYIQFRYKSNAKARKRGVMQALEEHPDAALVTFHKKRVGDMDYADNLRIVSVNGERARWFFWRPMCPAMYVEPGENRVELYAEWARRKYALEYCISEARFMCAPLGVAAK